MYILIVALLVTQADIFTKVHEGQCALLDTMLIISHILVNVSIIISYF